VQECAVIGWPDEQRGQIVKAVIVPRAGFDTSLDLIHALQDHMKKTLAPYKYPRAIEFTDALPKTPSGKLSRKMLRSLTA
jgi:2-aminobenzoate-CoA ligase